MTDDLVKRLREVPRDYDLYDHEIIYEAADHIEKLQARVLLLEGYLRGALDVVQAFSHAEPSGARAALEGKDD